MNEITTCYTYRCDLAKGPVEVNLPTPLMHQDALGDVFRVSVWKGGSPIDLTGVTATGYHYLAATQQTLLLNGSVSGSNASVTLEAGCYAMPGHASLVIQLQQGDVRHTVLKVNFVITRTGTANVVLPEMSGPSLPEMLAKIAAMEDATKAAQEAAATAQEGWDKVNDLADQLNQKEQLKPEFANSIDECTDTSKLYVLPDGYIYAYMLTETDPEPLYTNRLPEAINSDGTAYVGENGEDGYKDGYRVSSSGTEKEAAGYQATGFIPATNGDVIRIANVGDLDDGNAYCIVSYSDSAFAKLSGYTIYLKSIATLEDGVYTLTVAGTANTGGTAVAYARFTLVGASAETIITVNQEIKMSEGGTGYAWASTGHAFVPADYEDRIVELETDVAKHGDQIAALEKAVESGATDASIEAAYTRIKRWRYPIYEDTPVFLLESDKAALTGSYENTAAVYEKYDALMAAHSRYITREDCGMASDGTTPIYVYHFAEPTPHAFSTGIYLETKPVILVCSGVHPREIAGVYCMYYAMEEITTNPKLLDIRRNLHIIVMPMINPTAFDDTEYYMRNPDGIQVHYNFEVDFGANGAVQGDRNYGGTSPLSIPETQYFDALMAEHKDTLACVLSCHNNEVDEKYGTGFIWCSCATDYMVNLGNRFIDKMSAAWLDKHGTTFTEGISWANEYALEQAAAGTNSFFVDGFVEEQPDWDYRVGRASASGSGGTEYKQAIKYGVHGANVEVCPRCLVLDRDYSAKYTANVMTMGAETYINWFRTFMAAYDPKNKKDYAPNLPWE